MIPYTYFIHPEDDAALKAMKKVPGFDTLVKRFMQVGYETLLHGINMASKIRLSETQLPDQYKRVTQICDKLGLVYPEVYLEMSPIPNAYTYGDTNVFMVLTSGLFDYLADDEIDSVIAHEAGHIACHHVLYKTIANIIGTGLTGFWDSLAAPLRYAILYWDRKSELSADRAAALMCGVETVVRTQLRLSGGPTKLTGDVNIKEWAKQADEYEEIRNGSLWNKALQIGATINLTHPFSAVRVREALNWAKTEEFKAASEIVAGRMHLCPSCNQPIEPQWQYCRHCGAKLKTWV